MLRALPGISRAFVIGSTARSTQPMRRLLSLLLLPTSASSLSSCWPTGQWRGASLSTRTTTPGHGTEGFTTTAAQRLAKRGGAAAVTTARLLSVRSTQPSPHPVAEGFDDKDDISHTEDLDEVGATSVSSSTTRVRFATDYHAPVMWRECIDALLASNDRKDDGGEEAEDAKKKSLNRRRHRRQEGRESDDRESHRANDPVNNTNGGGRIFVDGTLGGGGHAHALLEHLGEGDVVYGCDVDPTALRTASERLREYVATTNSPAGGHGAEETSLRATESRGVRRRHPRLVTVASNFAHLHVHPQLQGLVGCVDGILLDLGVSSHQIDTAERGFTFSQSDGPLDMRMNHPGESPSSSSSSTTSSLRASDLCNELDEDELARILKRYGDEPRARAIAHSIADRRPLRTTGDLRDAVAAVTPAFHKQSRRKGLTATLARVFQALRIAVNQEDSMLERALLEMAPAMLKPGGRLVVLSYHSLEDRATKRAMRDGTLRRDDPRLHQRDAYGNFVAARPFLPVGKAVKASPEEVAANSRARSAVLRVAERL